MARIAVVWNFEPAKKIFPYWRDGLRRALEIIARTHKVHLYMGEDYKQAKDEYDAILIWADSNEPTIDFFEQYTVRKGIVLTTMPQNINNLLKYDIVFCESKPVYRACRENFLNSMHAFGVDTEFYKPFKNVNKDLPYFYPATFSPWKRQRDIAHYGQGLLCVGTVQPDGQEDLQACLDNRVKVETGYFPAEYIRDYYNKAKSVIIPAFHGSERTVLEAMSMDIFPLVTAHNEKAYSFVQEFVNSPYESPREFVIRKYSAERYAKVLLHGLRIEV